MSKHIVRFNELDYEYELITAKDTGELNQLIDHLNKHRGQMIAFDLETNGLDPFLGDRLTGVALYFPETGKAYYASFRHPETDNASLQQLNLLADALLLNNHLLLTWNGKFDLRFINFESNHVLSRKYRVEDVMIAIHLLDENRGHVMRGLNYKLKDVATQFIAKDAADEQAMLKDELKKRKLKDGEIGSLPASLVAPYAIMDVILTAQLRFFFMPYLDKWQVTPLYFENNQYYQYALLAMEINGLLIDRDEAQAASVRSQEIAKEHEKHIVEVVGHPINLNSPNQVVAWLGTENAQKKTLEGLAAKNPAAALIVKYKEYEKANSTYYFPYLRYSAGDGRIHPTFNITGTVTGRLSARDPNIQQVPRESETYNVKDVFIAPPGYVLVQIDYKQLELRLACHFSGEPLMTQMFLDGTDMHQYTADELGVPRQVGKTANFGFAYGMGAKGAMNTKGLRHLNYKEAYKLVKSWNALYPAFGEELKAMEDLAITWRTPTGEPAREGEPNAYRYIRLDDGRVRHYYNSKVTNARDFWNSLVQGTGNMIARRGILRVVNEYPDNDILKPVNTTHDSVMFYLKEDRLDILPNVVRLMTDFPEYNPPMGVDVEVGNRWSKLEKWRNA